MYSIWCLFSIRKLVDLINHQGTERKEAHIFFSEKTFSVSSRDSSKHSENALIFGGVPHCAVKSINSFVLSKRGVVATLTCFHHCYFHTRLLEAGFSFSVNKSTWTCSASHKTTFCLTVETVKNDVVQLFRAGEGGIPNPSSKATSLIASQALSTYAIGVQP